MVASVLAAPLAWVEPIPPVWPWQAIAPVGCEAVGNAWTMGARRRRLDYDLRSSYY
jgi:hypothetical protein